MQAWSQYLKSAYINATLDIRVHRVQVFSLQKKCIYVNMDTRQKCDKNLNKHYTGIKLFAVALHLGV